MTGVPQVLRSLSAGSAGVVIPGESGWRTADAVIGAEGLTVRRGPASCLLRWHDDWRFDAWTCTRHGDPIGLAVRSVPCAEALWPTWPWAVRHLLLVQRRRTAVPVWAPITAAGLAEPAIAVLSALKVFLAERPEAAVALVDPVRADRLARAMRERTPSGHDRVRAGWRRGFEVRGAMQRLGYEHRLGRPMPGWDRPSTEEAVGRVAKALASNPYLTDLAIDEGLVREIVRREYLDVEPWPFGALVD